MGATRPPVPAMSGTGSSRTFSARSLHGLVAHDIGERIVHGDLQPGDLLPNQTSLFGGVTVSRTAYREAVKVLAAKGLIEARPKSGTRVAARSHWNLLDPDVLAWLFSGKPNPVLVKAIFEMRLIFEPATAAMAAVRRSPEQLREIEAAFQAMVEAGGDAIFEADLRFHQAILTASGNPLVASLGMLIETALLGSFRLTHVPPGAFLPDHESVLESIAYQRPAEARERMDVLIKKAMQRVADADRLLPDNLDEIGF